MQALRVGALIFGGLFPAVVTAAPLESEPELSVRLALAINVTSTAAASLTADLAQVLSDAGRLRARVDAETDDVCLVDAACAEALVTEAGVQGLVFVVLRRIGSQVDIEATWFEPPLTYASLPRLRIDEQWSARLRREAFEHTARSWLEVLALAPRVASSQDGEAEPIASITEPEAAPGPEGSERELTRVPGLPLLRPPTIIAASAAAALAAGAVAFGISAKADEAELEADGCAFRVCNQDRIDAMDNKALASDLLVVGAVVSGLVAGLAHFVLSREGAGAEDVQVSGNGVRVAF